MQFKQYTIYKNSGVEWLGDVPEHWDSCNLKFISKIYAGGTPDRNRLDYWVKGEIPWINSGAVNQVIIKEPSEYITELGLKNSSAKYIPVNSLVMALAGQGRTKGMVAYTSIETTCNQSMAAIVPKNYHYKFLYYWLDSNYQNIRNLTGGDNRDGLNLAVLSNIPCPKISIVEQTQIVSFLDTETARIDNLIAKQEKLIELLEEQRKSIISHAVTKGLNPNAPMKDSGVEWLDEVPEHWRISSLKRYGYFKGGAGFPHAYQGNTEENIPFFKVNSLSKDKRFLSSFSDFVGEETAKKLGAKIFPKNSIFFAKVGAALLLERIRTNQQPCCIDNNMMGFVIQNELSFDFAFYLMSLIDFKYLVNPGAVPSINESQISSFLISVPPISEQTQIANYLDTETARIDNLIAKQKNLIEKLKEYRASIISHAVTGKIDVREFGA